MQKVEQPQGGLIRLAAAPRRLGRRALVAHCPRFPAQRRVRGLMEAQRKALAEAPQQPELIEAQLFLPQAREQRLPVLTWSLAG